MWDLAVGGLGAAVSGAGTALSGAASAVACSSCQPPAWLLLVLALNLVLFLVACALVCCCFGALAFSVGYAAGARGAGSPQRLSQPAAAALHAAGEAAVAAALGAGSAARQRLRGYPSA